MVQSILNPTVNFPEKKSIYKEDNDYDAPIYQYVINDVPVIIALGQANYTFIEDNILYYPIYLVVDNNANKDDSGIGVFEILDNNLPNILDSDGDIEIDKIGNPLLYQFVNQEKLSNSLDSNKNLLEPTNNDEENDNNEKNHEDVEVDEEESEYIESEDEESEDEENDDNKKFIIKENIDEKISIPEQNKKQEELEISEYKYTKNEPWVETYFKNNNYKLIDNEGGGDCLFAVIRDAFSEINKDLSVEEIRKKLSSEANQEIYKNYKELFTNYDLSIKENKDSMKKLKKINSELKDRLKNVKDKNNQLKIVEEAKKIASDFNKLKNELNLLENLKGEFNFMKNINSLEKFKEIIQTCEFWADTWAISTLERLLNIKLIIFSSEYYESDDLNNVLQCGQLNDPLLIEKNTFEPDYYILLDYTGIHYKLISYRDKTIFQFQQIPYAIKILITNKCLEKNSGPYYIIPAFKIFNENHGIQQDINLDGQIENISPNELVK